MNYIDLPLEFQALSGRVRWVQRINDNEYHSSCPNCGIDESKHSDANPSDRFIMWLESTRTGKPFGMCFRGCGWKWTPDKQDVHWTPEERESFVAKRKELNERENQRILEYSKNVVMKQAVYIKYAEALKNSTYGNMYLEKRGFNSPEWNKWFGYGIFEAYKCRGKFSTYYSPALTYPVSGLNKIVENVKLRVTEAKHSDDRFRNLYKAGNQSVYLPLHESKILNKVIIFEGEMKSNQVAMRGNLSDDITLIATQGKGIGQRLLSMVEHCEVVYLCLDPDTFIPNEKGDTNIMQNAKKIGYDRTRVIKAPKIDDALLRGFNLVNAYNMAVKPIQLGLKG